MKHNRTRIAGKRIAHFALTPLCLLLASTAVQATNGYFPHGYGIKAKGMGGASTAMAHDSIGGATNPASMVWVGNRIDLGGDVFMPKRDAERTDAQPPGSPLDGKVDSGRTAFLVPEFGYNRMMGSNMSLGVSVYGNGGMNTTYPQGTFDCGAGPGTANMLCGGGGLGVDLMQLIIAPTVAYKLNAQHAVGASLLLGYQRFKAQGLQAFQNTPGFSTDAANVTNRGNDSSTGVGLRLGYQGRLSDMLTVGASYAPKMSMGKFDKYRGLFAEAGGFDIPSHWSIGVAFMPTPAVTVALDFGRINYSDVKAVNNPSAQIGNCFAGDPTACLGGSNGPGFGWQDTDVFKLGVAWKMSNTLTLRAGYNKGDNPITAPDVTFNILAPGVMKDHYTAGFTYALDKDSEVSGALMISPRQTVTGASLFNALFGPGAGGNETIGMKQTSIGLSWGRKF